MKPVLPAVCGGIELEEPELDRTFGEGGMEVQHVVAAVVVVLAPVVFGILAAVPNVCKRRHRGRFPAVDLLQKSGVDRLAVLADPTVIKAEGFRQEVFVACHDVGKVPKGLGRVPLGSNVDVNAAASCGIAPGSCPAKAADELLQGLYVGVGENGRDHLAFFIVRTGDAAVSLELPLPTAFVPSRPGVIAVAVGGVPVAPGSEELSGDPRGFLSRDAVHLDFDPNGLLFHFGNLVFCPLAHFCASVLACFPFR